VSWVWVVIPLFLLGIAGLNTVFEANAQCCLGMPSTTNPTSLTISHVPKLGEIAHLTLIATNADGSTQRHDGWTRIILSDGFELVSGEIEKTPYWKHGEQFEHKITVQAIKSGNWTILGHSGIGSSDTMYVVVSEDNSYIHEGPFPRKPSYAVEINPADIATPPCDATRILQLANWQKNPSPSIDPSIFSSSFSRMMPPNPDGPKYDYSELQERITANSCSNIFSPSEISAILANATDTILLAPKQQLELGITSEYVFCKKDMKLIFKSSDNSPACVKPQTAEKLMERGWTIDKNLNSITKTSIEDIIDNVPKYDNQHVMITGKFFKWISWPELNRPINFEFCTEKRVHEEYAVTAGYWKLSDDKGSELSIRHETFNSQYNMSSFQKWSPPDEFLDKQVAVTGKIIPTIYSWNCDAWSSAYLLLEDLEDIQNYSE